MKTLPLTNSDKLLLLDDVDWLWLCCYNWFLLDGRYAVTNRPIPGIKHVIKMGKYGRRVYAHRAVGERLGLAGPEVDHEDQDKLNCQRLNLREATHQQNAQNRDYPIGISGYRGVQPSKDRWRARIMHDGKTICLGSFGTSREAALAYNAKVKEICGPFAVLNEVV